MKKFNLLTLCIVFTISFSCKEKQPEKGKDEIVDENVQLKSNVDQLVIELNVIAEEDDMFQILYRNLEESFTSDRQIQKSIKGSNQIQKVEFVLEPFEYPSHVRIYLGRNIDQQSLEIKGLVFKYNDAEHTFTATEMKKYFIPSNGLKIDFENGHAEIETINGEHTPYLNSNNLSVFVNSLKLN